jgi:hypothetical protein
MTVLLLEKEAHQPELQTLLLVVATEVRQASETSTSFKAFNY